MFGVNLSFEGVIRVDGALLRSANIYSLPIFYSTLSDWNDFLSVSPRRQYILFSTQNPPAVQRFPWPIVEDEVDDNALHGRPLSGHDTWILNDHEMPWLVSSDGKIRPHLWIVQSTKLRASDR